jgi:ABC-type phosphate/phosphonate transport system substrate-binding protein
MKAGLIGNARMYAVTPAVEAAWRALIGRVCAEAEIELDYLAYPAPAPLEALWTRADLGVVQMCGFPVALRLAPVTPLAAPIPTADWAGGQALYRSDLIVRASARYARLEDTFGGRAGWTVPHSHSGFNAFRHHLLGYRSAARPTLYASMTGDLVTARRVLEAVRDGELDVGPLDAYWHALLARHAPELVAGIRVLESTARAPIPAFVAGARVAPEAVLRLKAAFAAAAARPWFAALADTLLIQGFAPVTAADYALTLAWDRAAQAAGYPFPA